MAKSDTQPLVIEVSDPNEQQEEQRSTILSSLSNLIGGSFAEAVKGLDKMCYEVAVLILQARCTFFVNTGTKAEPKWVPNVKPSQGDRQYQPWYTENVVPLLLKALGVKSVEDESYVSMRRKINRTAETLIEKDATYRKHAKALADFRAKGKGTADKNGNAADNTPEGKLAAAGKVATEIRERSDEIAPQYAGLLNEKAMKEASAEMLASVIVALSGSLHEKVSKATKSDAKATDQFSTAELRVVNHYAAQAAILLAGSKAPSVVSMTKNAERAAQTQPTVTA